jgi:hypothetical protein
MALSIFSLTSILFPRLMDYVEVSAKHAGQSNMGEETIMGIGVVSKV